ncbi:MAG: hypothetical protein RBU25_20605, partial [Lentisphaeria bacterium]|nr:hypothetical protein [Lentisphaeria bacterium]
MFTPHARALLALLWSGFLPLLAGDWQVDTPMPGVHVLHNENGAWGGWSMGVSHQNSPDYQSQKLLDLTRLPAEVRAHAEEVRLRLYFGIQDYSWNTGDRVHNGLNEAFEIVVNDQPMRFQTSDPRFLAKAAQTDRLEAGWTDIDLPRELLAEDTLRVVIRKVAGDTKDDYIYPGIDNT